MSWLLDALRFLSRNLLVLLQIPIGVVLMRLVERPQAEIEGFGVTGLWQQQDHQRVRRARFRRTLSLMLALGASLLTGFWFPLTVDVIFLVIWLAGGAAAALFRLERANLISRTRTAVLAEAGVLWGVRLASWLFNLGSIAEWAAASGLSPESAAWALARNAGYANLVLLLAALLFIPGGFLSYLFQTFTVMRRDPHFRFASLEEILFDIVGRRQRGIY